MFLSLFLSGVMILPLAPPNFSLKLVWLPMVFGLNESRFLVGVMLLAFFPVKTYFTQVIFVFESIERQRIRPTPLRLWWVVLQSLLFFLFRQFTVMSAIALTLCFSPVLALFALAFRFSLVFWFGRNRSRLIYPLFVSFWFLTLSRYFLGRF